MRGSGIAKCAWRGNSCSQRWQLLHPSHITAANCVENTVTLHSTQQPNVLASQAEIQSYKVVLWKEVTLRALRGDTTQVFQIYQDLFLFIPKLSWKLLKNYRRTVFALATVIIHEVPKATY